MISGDCSFSEDFRTQDASGAKGILQPAVADPSCGKSSILRNLVYGMFPDELAEAPMLSCHCLPPVSIGSRLLAPIW
jgi:hypothetical protein